MDIADEGMAHVALSQAEADARAAPEFAETWAGVGQFSDECLNDSNLFGGASGHTYTLTEQPDGLTDIDAVVNREGKNLKGRVVAAFLGTVGKYSLAKAFAGSVQAIEARAGRGAVR